MSFSADTKSEISKIMPENRCCRIAELSALLLTCGRIALKGKMRLEIIVVTSENNVAHKLIELVRSLYDIKVDMMVSRNMRLNKNLKYSIKFYDSAAVRRLLEDTTVINYDKDSFCYIDHTGWRKLIKCEDCSRAFLRGVFSGAGSVNNPERHNHMEFVLYDMGFAEAFSSFLNECDMKCKMIERKGFYTVYLKEAESIIDVLRAVGSSSSLFKYENIRIKKEIVNRVNRLMNCDMANQNKSIDAAEKQSEDIKYIVENRGWDFLPNTLKEIAECRLSSPEASLSELGGMTDPPIGKSGVNHRMKRISEIAQELREANNNCR